ncbi:MAG: hypothetical protein FWC69_01620 [Defluviitaleaceae bacterium]|nr:hypothetical protein [Defluviitaleaceae bacterium]
MIRKIFVPLALAATALFALTACGGDDYDCYIYENGYGEEQNGGVLIGDYEEICPYCGEYAHGSLRQPTPPMHIHEIFAPWQGPDAPFPQEEHDANIAAFVADFENVHTVTYTEFETDWHGTIILWADEPLRDFSFVSLDIAGHDWSQEDELSLNTREVIFAIPKLSPADVVVLNLACSHYLLPYGASSSTGEEGL